jgi:hypothetical protein
MRADGESGTVEVGDEALFVVHGLERRGFVWLGGMFEKRTGRADGGLDLPESVAAVKEECRVSGFGF